MIGEPTKDQAHQFALISSSGMPHAEVIRYFYPDEENQTNLRALLQMWLKSKVVQEAILAIQGKAWQEMSLEERIKYSVDKHYSELAYYLYSNNYAELEGTARQKADTCRQTLETKLAGMAGKLDAVTSFWADVVSGKVKLNNGSVVGGSPPTTRPS